MKKGASLVLLFLFVGIFLISFVSSVSCSGTGYSWRVVGYYKTDCTGDISLDGDSRCVTFSSHSSCVNMGSWGQKWTSQGSETITWTCSDSGYTTNYQCSGSAASREYLTASCGNLWSDNNDCFGGCGAQTSSYVSYPTWNYKCCQAYNWYNDADNDGWYNGTAFSSCTRPSSIWKNETEINVVNSGDCNNTDPNINPGMPEIIQPGTLCSYQRITNKITSGSSRCNDLAGDLVLPKLPCDTRPGGNDCGDTYSYLALDDVCIGQLATINSKTGYLACENTETQPCTDCADVPRVIIYNLTKSLEYGVDENCNGLIDEGFQINKPYWADLINSSKNISSTAANSTVLMIAPGAGLTSAINYTIWENVPFWFDNKMSSSNNLGINSWKVSRVGNFYFTVRINSIINTSDNLAVSGNKNKFPQVLIQSPSENIKISTGSNIYFSQGSYDEDDLLNITWNFGDGTYNKTTGYSLALTPFAADLLHNYSTSGGKIITLTAAESSRTQSNSTSITLYVFKPGINVVAIIASPENGANAPNDVVRFNASESYVVNCTPSSVLSSEFAFSLYDEKLNCSYVHRPNTKIINGNYSLILNWTFNDGSKLMGNWSNYSGVVDFVRIYTQAGSYYANLSIIYKPSIGSSEVGSRDVNFLSNGGWYCDDGETSAFWRKSGSSPFDATLNCTKYSDSSCCPLNRNVCQENGSCTGLIDGPASFCDDLTTAYTCTHASDNIVFDSIPNSVMCDQITARQIGGRNCYNQTSCGCVWRNNICSPSFSSDYFCDNEPPVPYGECYWSTAREDKCNQTENAIILRGTHIWNPLIGTPETDPVCADYVKSIPCVSSAKLPFFDKINVMFVLLGLVIVYFLFNKKFR